MHVLCSVGVAFIDRFSLCTLVYSASKRATVDWFCLYIGMFSNSERATVDR